MVGGLIVSQALTLFTTPVVYLYLDRLSNAALGQLAIPIMRRIRARKLRSSKRRSDRPSGRPRPQLVTCRPSKADGMLPRRP